MAPPFLGAMSKNGRLGVEEVVDIWRCSKIEVGRSVGFVCAISNTNPLVD